MDRVVLGAVLALAALLLLLAAPGRSAETCGSAQGRFLALPGPAGAERLVAFGVSADGRTVLVSDGAAAWRSTDGGCGWREVARPGAGERFEALALVGDVALLAGSAEAPGTGQRLAFVRRSTDRGATFRPAVAGAAGRVRDVELGPQAATALLLVDDNPDDVLLVSDDGGATFDRRLSPTGGLPDEDTVPTTTIGIDLLDAAFSTQEARRLWVTRGRRLFVSDDLGERWQAAVREGEPTRPLVDGTPAVVDEAGALSALLVDRPQGGAADRVLAVAGSQPPQVKPDALHVSRDGGTEFVRLEPSGFMGFWDAAASVAERTFVVSRRTRDGLFRFDEASGTFELVETSGLIGFHGLLARAGELWTMGERGLVRYRPPAAGEADDTREPPELLPPGTGTALAALRSAPLRDPAPARLEGVGDLALAAGLTRTFDAALVLPPRPSPMDVFQLHDASGSSIRARRQLRGNFQDVIDALAGDGVDTRYGIATFTDYPVPPYGANPDKAYQRNADIAKPDRALARGMTFQHPQFYTTTATGTSQNTALFQAVTGAGQGPVLGSQSAAIPPGQQATWREGTIRVLLTLADQPAHKGPAHPSPLDVEVEQALRRARALVVGVNVDPQDAVATTDLAVKALASGALAREAVDCGPESMGVPSGGPLVCAIDTTRRRTAAATVLALLRAVPDRGDVELRVEGGARISRSRFTDLDLKAPQRLATRVELSCPGAARGETREVRVIAAARGRDVASAALSLRCGTAAALAAVPPRGRPTRQAPPDPPGSPAPPPGAVAAPAPAPPAPAPQQAVPPLAPPPAPPAPAPVVAGAPAPASAPATASVPASAGSPAGASAPSGAAEAERRRRGALARAFGRSGGEELAMVAARPADPAVHDATTALGGAILLTVGAALAGVRPRQRPPAPARRRSR